MDFNDDQGSLYTEKMLDDIKKDWNNNIKGSTKRATAGNIINRIDKGAKKLDSTANVDNRSIIAKAKNSIMQFPVYITQALRIDEAQALSSFFERVYASMVQMVLSQNQIIDEDEVNNLNFLKNFHTNLKEASEVLIDKYYEPIDEIDEMMQESISCVKQITENCYVKFDVVPTIDKNIIAENARLMNEPLTGLNLFIEDTTNSANSEEVEVKRSDLIQMALDKGIDNLTHADIDNAEDGDTYAKERVDEAVRKLASLMREKIKDPNNHEYDGYKVDGAGKVFRIVITAKSSKRISSPQPAQILRDTDIKKINKSTPYSIAASFYIRDASGKLVNNVSYVFGVKSVLHLIRTQDLQEEIPAIINGKNKRLNKVRYKTGEISFMDYLLNLKEVKADAGKTINYNKRWISTLKRLSDYSITYKSMLKDPIELIQNGSVPIPNGTLILSQPDITLIANQTGIDLSKVSNAKKLAKNLFLIAIAIVDPSANSMRILFPDQDADWDVQSMSSIQAEVSKTDNSALLKELNRVVNKR